MLNFGGVYRKFSKFFFWFFFWTPQKNTTRTVWDGRFGEAIPDIACYSRRFRFAGLDVETSALEAGNFHQVLGISMGLEPKWPLFWLEFGPCFGGLTFKNRGHLSSRWIWSQSISYTTRKLTKNMSRKKGGRFFFPKEVNHLDLFSWIFRGYFGYSCVFGDMLVSYSFEIWPSKALLEKQADHCGVGISRSEGREGWRRQ